MKKLSKLVRLESMINLYRACYEFDYCPGREEYEASLKSQAFEVHDNIYEEFEGYQADEMANRIIDELEEVIVKRKKKNTRGNK